jgi:hypothetical protein
MIIAVDFDGTIVEHAYPEIGAPIPYALETLKDLRETGCQIILWTVRSDNKLEEAVDYCKENGLELWGVNENPTQLNWSMSKKAYAHMYIDDAAFGCPLIIPDDGRRPFVDWVSIRNFFFHSYLKGETDDNSSGGGVED